MIVGGGRQTTGTGQATQARVGCPPPLNYSLRRHRVLTKSQPISLRLQGEFSLQSERASRSRSNCRHDLSGSRVPWRTPLTRMA